MSARAPRATLSKLTTKSARTVTGEPAIKRGVNASSWPTPTAAGTRPAGKLLRDKLPFSAWHTTGEDGPLQTWVDDGRSLPLRLKS